MSIQKALKEIEKKMVAAEKNGQAWSVSCSSRIGYQGRLRGDETITITISGQTGRAARVHGLLE